MLTFIILRLAARDPHNDGPYLAFAAVLADLVVILALGVVFTLTVSGVALAPTVIGWVLALIVSTTDTQDTARHLNRKVSR